jgi:hypothetical protein
MVFRGIEPGDPGTDSGLDVLPRTGTGQSKPSAPYPGATNPTLPGGINLDQIAAQQILAGAVGDAKEELTVLRPGKGPARNSNPGPYGLGRRLTPAEQANLRKPTKVTAPLSSYNAEFFTRWSNPNFQTWITSRMAALGVKDRSVENARNFWVAYGEQTSKAPGFKGTPEQYIEYMANGGRYVQSSQVEADMANGAMAIDPATGLPVDGMSGVEGEPWVNPIQKQTTVSRTTINAADANAAVDEFSRALLGRMATEKEMGRLRKVMGKYLSAHPDVRTEVRDATNPDDVRTTVNTKAGASAADAQKVVEMQMRRGSEGMAFNAGKMFEDALRMMG